MDDNFKDDLKYFKNLSKSKAGKMDPPKLLQQYPETVMSACAKLHF